MPVFVFQCHRNTTDRDDGDRHQNQHQAACFSQGQTWKQEVKGHMFKASYVSYMIQLLVDKPVLLF